MRLFVTAVAACVVFSACDNSPSEPDPTASLPSVGASEASSSLFHSRIGTLSFTYPTDLSVRELRVSNPARDEFWSFERKSDGKRAVSFFAVRVGFTETDPEPFMDCDRVGDEEAPDPVTCRRIKLNGKAWLTLVTPAEGGGRTLEFRSIEDGIAYRLFGSYPASESAIKTRLSRIFRTAHL